MEKKYYSQLDSLRAFAVAGVAWHHWKPAGDRAFSVASNLQHLFWMPDYSGVLPFASGVQLFFVLSGFLITGILLDVKQKADEQGNSLEAILKSFYIRRFLRIFPLFYIVLMGATFLNISNLRSTWPWHSFYLSNFYFIRLGHLDGAVSHFWTLAVEEQFYLVWPFVILLINNRKLPYVLWLVFAVGPIYRLVGDLYFSDIDLWKIGTPACFDSLAIGALLAYYKRNSFNIPTWLNLTRAKYVAVFVLLLGFMLTSTTWIPNASVGRLDVTFLSLVYGVLIDACVDGIGGPVGRALNFPPLVYVGTISYGLYVLHNFADYPVYATLQFLPRIGEETETILVLKLFWTLGLALISWNLFEKPLNQLKRHFPYFQETLNSRTLLGTTNRG